MVKIKLRPINGFLNIFAAGTWAGLVMLVAPTDQTLRTTTQVGTYLIFAFVAGVAQLTFLRILFTFVVQGWGDI